VDPVMPALVRLRDEPDLLGVSLRAGQLRIYAAEPEKLLTRWSEHWPFADLQLKGHRWVDPDMEDVFTAYSQGYTAVLKPLPKR
ncbi:MAG TPA: ABC transporter ATP-binding protein, partial [Chthoniobacterales bacterium]